MDRALRTILGGFALATSWTWCIGMFAPVLIGSLFGWPGVLAFAIPNVLGCALFGYLRSAERSRAETRDHALAMAIFSGATVAYQVFFAGFLWGRPVADFLRTTEGESRLLASGAVLAAALGLAALPRQALWILAAIAYPLSLLAFLFLPWESFHGMQTHGEWTLGQLALVLPTIVFGFMLSPNLDLTFHRARQEVAEGERPHRFAVFGVAFASMLVLTFAYASITGGLNSPAVRAHMAVQLVLTSALHLSELRSARIGSSPRIAIASGAALLGVVAALAAPDRDTYFRFLGLYGLAFPAYAALALRAGGRPTVLGLVALAVALVVSAPIVEHAFLEGPNLLAPLGVALPIAAVVLFGGRKKPKTA